MNKLALALALAAAAPSLRAQAFGDVSGVLGLARQRVALMRTAAGAQAPVTASGAVDLKAATEQELTAYLKGLPADQREKAVIQTARLLGPALNTRDFGGLDALVRVLLSLDGDSGYALYFQGEGLRKRGDKDGSAVPFRRYLEREAAIPEDKRRTGPEAAPCYGDATGYCQQRTAWICHLLANDLAEKGKASGDAAVLEEARAFARRAVENFPPKGFDAAGQLTPTAALLAELDALLAPTAAR